MIQGLRYFSVAVTNLEETVKQYQDMFGLKQMTPIRETSWGFRATMLGNGETAFIEIVQPAKPDSALARHMKERARPQNPQGEGVYVVSVEVDDWEATIKNIRDHGGKVIQQPETPDLAWAHPLSTKYVLLELHRKGGRTAE